VKRSCDLGIIMVAVHLPLSFPLYLAVPIIQEPGEKSINVHQQKSGFSQNRKVLLRIYS
jgi:hypothetical protein